MKPPLLIVLLLLPGCSTSGIDIYAPEECASIEQMVVVHNKVVGCLDIDCYQKVVNEVCGSL